MRDPRRGNVRSDSPRAWTRRGDVAAWVPQQAPPSAMKWGQARRLLPWSGSRTPRESNRARDDAARGGSVDPATHGRAPQGDDPGVAGAVEATGDSPGTGPTSRRAASLCVVSGKGGTGKSVVSASIATCLSRFGRTLLVDVDLGVGNAHILQDLTPVRSMIEVADGSATVREVRVPCSTGLDLIPGGSGVSRLASLSPYQVDLMAVGLEELEQEYDHLLLDSAAGISDQTVTFAAACDEILLVTTPDVTAMTDAYAFLKVLLRSRPGSRPLLVVNRAEDEAEAKRVAQRIREVAGKFLGSTPLAYGWIPDDRAVVRSVAARRPVVDSEPDSPAGSALRGLADRLGRRLRGHGMPVGVGASLLGGRARGGSGPDGGPAEPESDSGEERLWAPGGRPVPG